MMILQTLARFQNASHNRRCASLVNKLLAFVNIDINFNGNETRTTERKLKLVKQKETWDCAIACVAMIVGRSYKEVHTNLQKNYTNRGTSCDTMMRYLKRHGIKTELERYEFETVHLHAFVNAYDCTSILLLKNTRIYGNEMGCCENRACRVK